MDDKSKCEILSTYGFNNKNCILSSKILSQGYTLTELIKGRLWVMEAKESWCGKDVHIFLNVSGSNFDGSNLEFCAFLTVTGFLNEDYNTPDCRDCYFTEDGYFYDLAFQSDILKSSLDYIEKIYKKGPMYE